MASTVGALAYRALSMTYGFTMFGFMAFLAVVRDGILTRNRRMSEEEKREFELAQEQYWDLSKEPLPCFRHAFFDTPSGVRLHYVVSSEAELGKGKNLIIFIHGFPDSYLLWREALSSNTVGRNKNIMVALDLPGYGGSDSLKDYGPDHMLEAVTGFVLGMREKYHKEGSKVILVTHDWGALIGARLAAEAPSLADRFILMSALVPQHGLSNATSAINTSKQMLRTYTRSPFQFRLLRSAFNTILPVLSQCKQSFYVFIFNLPFPVASLFATFGNYWFVRLLHRVQAGTINPKGTPMKPFTRELKAGEAAMWLAHSSGPGERQLKTEIDEKSYPSSVRLRVPNLGMTEKIRIYRENLVWGPWEKSLETIVSLNASTSAPGPSASIFETGPQGSLKAPATIICGKHDIAFESRLTVDGMSDYLAQGSQLVMLKGGHWLPSEKLGQQVLDGVLCWCLGANGVQMGSPGWKGLMRGFDGVSVLVDKSVE